METVMFIDEFGEARTEKMNTVPSIGDTVPFFYTPNPVVKKVVWFPQEMENGLTIGRDIHVLVLLGKQA